MIDAEADEEQLDTDDAHIPESIYQVLLNSP